MNRAVVLFLVLFFPACDCVQEVRGIVVDEYSRQPVEGVKIWKQQRPETAQYSSPDGFFIYYGISGGFRKCPDATLVFEKDGYEKLENGFSSTRGDTVLILLRKKRN